MTADVSDLRGFNRDYTRGMGILTDRYLGQTRPLGQARLLYELGSDPDLATVHERLGLDTAAITRMVRALREQGLVELDAAPGAGPPGTAVLTTRGRRELAELDARATASADRMLSTLTYRQRERLGDALREARALLRLAAIDVRAVDPSSPPARTCLAAYAAELRDRFPEGFDESDLVSATELTGRAGSLIVASEAGRPVGCAAVRTLEAGVGEVRHMWAHPRARGIGLGRRLLQEVEDHSAGLGLHTLRLGTHEVLGEAIALYRSAGYVERRPYGDTPHVHHWFEKRL